MPERVPKGVRTAGQWTSAPKTEPTTALASTHFGVAGQAQALRAERGGKPFVNARNATAGAPRKSDAGVPVVDPADFAALLAGEIEYGAIRGTTDGVER